MSYLAIKHTHVSLAVASILFFVVRAWWSYCGSPRLRNPLVRIMPHIIDSLLLTSALALAAQSHQLPFQQSWLTAKVVALCGYIALGSLAIKRAPTRGQRALAALLAVAVYGYILAVASARSPIPFP